MEAVFELKDMTKEAQQELKTMLSIKTRCYYSYAHPDFEAIEANIPMTLFNREGHLTVVYPGVNGGHYSIGIAGYNDEANHVYCMYYADASNLQEFLNNLVNKEAVK